MSELLLLKDFTNPSLRVDAKHLERGHHISASLSWLSAIFPYHWSAIPQERIVLNDDQKAFKVMIRCTEQDTPQRDILKVLGDAISEAGFCTTSREDGIDIIIHDTKKDAFKWQKLSFEINGGIIDNALFGPSLKSQ